MKKEPCIRLGMRIRPKIREKPADSRNKRPPRARLLIARMAACADVICVIIESGVSPHLTARRNHGARVATAPTTAFPPPLWGRDRERGNDRLGVRNHPPPHPSPARGEGGARCTHAASRQQGARSNVSGSHPLSPIPDTSPADRHARRPFPPGTASRRRSRTG